MPITVELLYFEGCPSYKAFLPRLRQLLAQAGADAAVLRRRVESDEAAQREHFVGSPTVRIQGRDIEPDAQRRNDYGLKCRLYETPYGLRGTPLTSGCSMHSRAPSVTGADPTWSRW